MRADKYQAGVVALWMFSPEMLQVLTPDYKLHQTSKIWNKINTEHKRNPEKRNYMTTHIIKCSQQAGSMISVLFM